MNKPESPVGCGCGSDFSTLLKYTLSGYLISLICGLCLDQFGLVRSGIGQALVRTFAGEGESLFEGVFSIRQRLRNKKYSLAESYGWGKLAGLAAPWVIDGLSRQAGIDPYMVGSFYIPFCYAMSDQIGALVAGILFFRSREKSWASGILKFLSNPVMMAGLAVILISPTGLLVARLLGFSPDNQVKTAFETIAANLCWIPVVVGTWLERREKVSEDVQRR